MCHDNEKWCKIWRKIDLSFQNWHEKFDEFWLEHLKVSKIFILVCSFWAKYIVLELKKYREVIVHETEEGYKIWRGIDLRFENWHKVFDKVWPEYLKVSKMFTLMGSFWAKDILFELKKNSGVIFHDMEQWCKIWRKTDLWFEKWHQKFGKFPPEHSKESKLELWWDPCVQSIKCMSLKFTEELCVEELTCRFKIDMRNFTNFDPSTRKSKTFMSLLAPCDQGI